MNTYDAFDRLKEALSARAVLETDDETGFRTDVVEKVLRLCGILNRLQKHPSSEGMWVLKGGTALNLIHLDVPRMSVDIDLNFVGVQEVDGMREARPGFEDALTAGKRIIRDPEPDRLHPPLTAAQLEFLSGRQDRPPRFR